MGGRFIQKVEDGALHFGPSRGVGIDEIKVGGGGNLQIVNVFAVGFLLLRVIAA